MKTQFYTLLGAAFLIVSCGSEREIVVAPVAVQPAQPVYSHVYPQTNAVILSKRILSNTREEYRARLNSGREITFVVNNGPYYNVGDAILVP
jgi:hypothetical protein